MRHAVAALIPWYANGTLGDAERQEVERHLPSCAECRELLAQAAAFVEAAPEAADLAGHVQAQLLAEFVEDRRSLDAEVALRVASHLDGCAICRDAAAALATVATEAERETPGVPSAIWRALTSTVLHPVAALVYLAILVAVPVERRLSPSPRSSVSSADATAAAKVLPPRIGVRGEDTFRGLPDAGGPLGSDLAPPMELPGNGREILLEVHTDIDSADLEDGAAAFDLELSDGERVVWSDRKVGSDFENGRDRLLVLLSTEHLSKGATYVLRIRLVRPGDAAAGQIVFQRRVRLALRTASPYRQSPAATNPVQR